MRLIDADVLLHNLEQTENDLLRNPVSFEKTLTIAMVEFTIKVIEKFLERNGNNVDSS